MIDTKSQDYIQKVFDDFSLGQELLTRVETFYGDSFSLEIIETSDRVSSYHFDLGGESEIFQCARIQLNSESRRQRAAAFHELLHLCQPVRGFALIQQIISEPKDAAQMDFLIDIQNKIQNVIAHDCFLDEFLQTGLPLSEFIVPRTETHKYEDVAKSYRRIKRTPEIEWHARSWWAFEYFNNYIGIAHGDLQAKQLAEHAERSAIKVLPDFGDTAQLIRNWVGRKKHCKAATYVEAVRELLELMKYPEVVFCVLDVVRDAPPSIRQIP